MAKLTTRDKIKTLLNSKVSAYQIAQHTKASESAISKLRHGESKLGNLSLDAGLSLAKYYDNLGNKPMNAWDELIGLTLAKMSVALVQYETNSRGINEEYAKWQGHLEEDTATSSITEPGYLQNRMTEMTGYQRKLDSYYSFLESINAVMITHRITCSIRLSGVIYRLKVLTDGSINKKDLDKDITYLSSVARMLIPKHYEEYDVPVLIKTLAFNKKKSERFSLNGMRSF